MVKFYLGELRERTLSAIERQHYNCRRPVFRLNSPLELYQESFE